MWAGITGVIVGILIGSTAVWIWLKSRPGGPDEVSKLKRESEQFREEVNEHFVQTAELINQLTDSYKAVFDHLSDGAEKLVEPDAVRGRMPQVTDEEVRLKRLGAPAASSSSDNDDKEPPTRQPEQADEGDRDGDGPEPEGKSEPDQPR